MERVAASINRYKLQNLKQTRDIQVGGGWFVDIYISSTGTNGAEKCTNRGYNRDG